MYHSAKMISKVQGYMLCSVKLIMPVCDILSVVRRFLCIDPFLRCMFSQLSFLCALFLSPSSIFWLLAVDGWVNDHSLSIQTLQTTLHSLFVVDSMVHI